MSTLVTQAPSVQHWLPGPARPIDAACPACGGLDSLVYSVGDAYVACTGCGWQRTLNPKYALQAACAQGKAGVTWAQVLARLALFSPDPRPPVPALLWRQTGPATWQGPSRTTPDTIYTITRTAHRIKCDCPNLNTATCWHKLRARELGCVDLTAASDLWPD